MDYYHSDYAVMFLLEQIRRYSHRLYTNEIYVCYDFMVTETDLGVGQFMFYLSLLTICLN